MYNNNMGYVFICVAFLPPPQAEARRMAQAHTASLPRQGVEGLLEDILGDESMDSEACFHTFYSLPDS